MFLVKMVGFGFTPRFSCLDDPKALRGKPNPPWSGSDVGSQD